MLSAPEDAKTVPVRVQVIDLQPRIVDLVVPTFMPADDLTQRIARDAGLGGWWEGGRRRTYWLRARGRILQASERLADVGVVPYELLHLLPEPRSEDHVRERDAGLPDVVPLSFMSRLVRTLAALAWVGLWVIAVGADGRPAVMWWGAFILAYLVRGVVDGWWSTGGRWGQLGVAGVLTAPLCLPAMANAWMVSIDPSLFLLELAMTALGMGVGTAVAHLVWMGPVSEVTAIVRAASGESVRARDELKCFVCGEMIDLEVLTYCRYGCGRPMHSGCQKLREAMTTGPPCEVCAASVR
jgi:hypothetical protein